MLNLDIFIIDQALLISSVDHYSLRYSNILDFANVRFSKIMIRSRNLFLLLLISIVNLEWAWIATFSTIGHFFYLCCDFFVIIMDFLYFSFFLVLCYILVFYLLRDACDLQGTYLSQLVLLVIILVMFVCSRLQFLKTFFLTLRLISRTFNFQ